MGLKNILQYIAEGKFPGGQAIGKKEDIRKPDNNSGLGKIDYSSSNNYDARRYMYGNGSSTAKKSTPLVEQIQFGNGSSSSSSPKPEPTNYLGEDDTTPVTHGPTTVIGETNNTPKPDPEVIIPENVTSSDDGESGVVDTTTPNPNPVTPGAESLVEESSPEDYSNTGAETVEDTWTIVEVPEEPVVDIPTEPDNNSGSNHGLPENYLDGYSDNPLTASAGRIVFNGHEETYYNLDMSMCITYMRNLGFSEFEYPYSVREDGVKTLGGYVMVAADFNLYPRGTIVETSLGPGIVVDTGDFAYTNNTQFDIAVTWQ